MPDNNLLKCLRDEDFALIESKIEPADISTGSVLYNPGDHVAWAYFPCGPTLVSYLVTNIDGQDVETVLVGREGAVGGIVSSGHLPAYCLISAKVGGPCVCIPIEAIRSAKSSSPTFKRLFTRYADCLMAQMFQATACNALHSIEQRTAKWILAARDRTGRDDIALTQQELATLLGVGRSYVSRVLQKLKHDGLIEIARGNHRVIKVNALRGRSCRCNDSVKSHFDVVLKGVYPD
ncbi:MAG: Crp/Fnr family transcriptional regulator [Hyphomicrobiaceae bacterium]